MKEITFGKKIDRSEAIDKVINSEYLNESLRQKLRDKFNIGNDQTSNGLRSPLKLPSNSGLSYLNNLL